MKRKIYTIKNVKQVFLLLTANYIYRLIGKLTVIERENKMLNAVVFICKFDYCIEMRLQYSR